ncbi:MAG: MBL fold metallo-hydrolase [Clostridiales bacterium]|nr:MBL fold metallo-hydrolase [Clostridiales bacterium]
MKRLLAILITVLLALAALAGCGGGQDDGAGAVSGPAGEPAPAGDATADDADAAASAEGAGQDEGAGLGEGGQEKGDGISMETATLLYQGHGSLRITTGEGKVIYIDPYAGEGYDKPADLILVTHAHSDHDQVKLIKNKNPDCVTITYKEALAGGQHQVFELGYATVEATEAGNNKNHDIRECVGFILTLDGGKAVYVSGDTSTTDQMATLAGRGLDYAFFCCDGVYNMDVDEASACAALVKAKHSIPYHMAPGELFSQERAEMFVAENRMIMAAGEEIALI